MDEELKKILAALKEVGDQVKNQAEDAKKQVTANGQMSESLRAKVDETLQAQGDLRAQLVEVQQHVAAMKPAGESAPQSLGARFAGDEKVRNFCANPMAGGKIAVSLKNAVTSAAGSAGQIVVPTIVPGIQAPGAIRLTIRDLLMWGRTVSNSVEFFREVLMTNNAAPVSELITKPQSDITFEADQAPVATIAHWIKASRQILADAPLLQGYIDGRLRYGLKLKEEGQLLNGSGVGINIKGLKTAATDYANPGVVVDSENRMDRLRLALLQAELAGYPADGIVLNPVDWTAIELKKTAGEKQYLVGNPFGVMTPTLWGRPVVATPSMAIGDYLVGAFGTAAQGWDREDVSVQLSIEDGNNFTQNAVTLLCEERVALTIYREDALITGSFTSGM